MCYRIAVRYIALLWRQRVAESLEVRFSARSQLPDTPQIKRERTFRLFTFSGDTRAHS